MRAYLRVGSESALNLCPALAGTPVGSVLAIWVHYADKDEDRCARWLMSALAKPSPSPSPRFLRALNFRCNIADTQKRSAAYDNRLERYAVSRGICVAVPGLDVSLVDSTFSASTYWLDPRSGKLLVIGDELGANELPDRFVFRKGEAACKAKIRRRTKEVKELARLMVLGGMCSPEGAEYKFQVLREDTFYEPSVGREMHHVAFSPPAPGAPLLLAALRPRAGPAADISDSDGPFDESNMYEIFRRLFRHAADTTKERMQEMAGAPHLPPDTWRRLNASFERIVMHNIAQKKHVGLVYRVLRPQSSDDLGYVMDARRGILSELPEGSFEEAVGIPQRMRFSEWHEAFAQPVFWGHYTGDFEVRSRHWISAVCRRE